MKVRVVALLMGLAVALVASAVVPGLSSADSGFGDANVSKMMADVVLVIAMDTDIEVMDPAKTAAMYGPPSMVYETLITRDKTGAYAPGLAEAWELRDMRGTGYPHEALFNITLKQGVKFHDGSAFNYSAVKRIINYYTDNYSWNQYVFWSVYGCQNKTGWPDSGLWCRDAYHLTINLTWADVALIFNLSNLYGSMMSPDALESDGLTDYGTPGHKVVGTGPFILQEWVPGDHVTLTRNGNYTWGAPWYTNPGPAKIDKVIYRIIPDRATRFAAFESGAIHVLQQVPPYKAFGFSSASDVTLITGPGQGTYHIDFNCEKAPWTDSTLRKAFGYAVNRTLILDVVWHGYGEEGVNYLAPIEPESRKVPAMYNFSYDVVKSEQLFLQAGWDDTDSDGWLENTTSGNELTLPLWTTNRAEEVAMSELLQQAFQDVGVHVALTQYSEDMLRTMASAGMHDAVLLWYSWPRAEILDWQFGTWAMGGSNIAYYSDPVFDNYVVNWTLANTEKEFSDNATAGHIRLLTKAPRVPILYWHQIDAVHNNVTGWYANPYGMEQVFDIVDVDIAPDTLVPELSTLIVPVVGIIAVVAFGGLMSRRPEDD